MVPQVVDDEFGEFLWESSSGRLDRSFLSKKPRQDVLVERALQPG